MLPEQAELVTEAKVLRLLEVAREAYDIVVIDTSPFFYGPMLALLGPTDQLLLLCGLDVPTLKNVQLSLRTLELLGFPSDAHEPRAQPRHAERRPHGRGRRPRRSAMRVAFEIPNDPVVAPAVNRGAVPALHETESEFAQAVARIAASLQPTIAAHRRRRRLSERPTPRLRRFVPRASSKGGCDGPRRTSSGATRRAQAARG